MTEDGLIKFKCDFIKRGIINPDIIKEINEYRWKLFKQKLIGVYPEGHKQAGIGYGNISERPAGFPQFLISGSQTGHLENLTEEHYSIVTSWDRDKNSLVCRGQIKASSESMTHAEIYDCDGTANAVIHIHNLNLWNKLRDIVPTTSEEVPYGTPEMAYEIERLFKETDVRKKKILVMGGHKEGIITFGKTLYRAYENLMKYL